MNTLKKDDIVELKIEDIGAEGRGIGRYNGELVVFVPAVVPGDLVKVKISKLKKKFAEAILYEIIEASENRVKPECEYFGTCNGCKMQNISYYRQLEIKQNIVKNAFNKIGGFKDIKIPEVIGSDDIYFYRNKLEFSFSNDRWLEKKEIGKENIDKNFAVGYHIPRFIEKILDIKKCYLLSEISNKVLNLTRGFFKDKNTSVYSTKTHAGYLRFLTVRRSVNTGEVMVNLITYDNNPKLINEYAALLQKKIPEVTTFVNSLTNSKAQVALADNYNTVYGNGYITENIGGYEFKITPNAFFQTNSKQCEKLFKFAADMAEFNGSENVLDLYCGCGAISIYISGKVNKIYGVELSNESIEMANENSKLNKTANCEFIAMDVKEFFRMVASSLHGKPLQDRYFKSSVTSPPAPLLKGEGEKELKLPFENRLAEGSYPLSSKERGKGGEVHKPDSLYNVVNPAPFLKGEGGKDSMDSKFDVIILDPPRSGIHPKAAEYLLQYEAKRIIYVSCNPATQARDIALLREKYEITAIQPVDMFPHTFHIENVVRLDLKLRC